VALTPFTAAPFGIHGEKILVGIAKRAVESPRLASKRRVEYFSLTSNSILNRCLNPRLPFNWTINPYRGCEFGCKYCYARYTHEFMGLENPQEFEEKIYSKDRAAEILATELRQDPGGAIAIGTATDPYQPAERLYKTTRSILETLAEFRGLRLSITTKSDLVTVEVTMEPYTPRYPAIITGALMAFRCSMRARRMPPSFGIFEPSPHYEGLFRRP